jgi:hypothetical protein
MPELFSYYSEDKRLCQDEAKMQLVMQLLKEAVEMSIKPNHEGNRHSHRLGPQEFKDLWDDNWDYDYCPY